MRTQKQIEADLICMTADYSEDDRRKLLEMLSASKEQRLLDARDELLALLEEGTRSQTYNDGGMEHANQCAKMLIRLK